MLFGDCSLNRDGLLSTPAGQQQLSKRQAAILRDLAEAEGEAVDRDLLLDRHWGPGSGSSASMAKSIYQLRQALGCSDFVDIDAIYGHGYRLRLCRPGTAANDHTEKSRAMCAEAQHRLHELSAQSLNTASAMYLSARKLNPGFVTATIGYAQVQFQQLATGQVGVDETWPALQQILHEAQNHDSHSADLLAVLAKGQCLCEWDLKSAYKSLNIALRMAPADYIPNDTAARILLFQGRHQDALTYLQRALDANPFSGRNLGLLAFTQCMLGDVDAALEAINEAYQFDTANVELQAWYAVVHALHGDVNRAAAVATSLKEHLEGVATIEALAALALVKSGRHAQARIALESLEPRRGHGPSGAMLSAIAWCSLGDLPAAARCLEVAADDREYWLGTFLFHRELRCLHSQATYQKILNQIRQTTPEPLPLAG